MQTFTFSQYSPLVGDTIEFIDDSQIPPVRVRGVVDEVSNGEPWSVWARENVSLETGSTISGRLYSFGSDIWRAKRGDRVYGCP